MIPVGTIKGPMVSHRTFYCLCTWGESCIRESCSVCDRAPPFFKAASKRGQRVLAHYAEREQTRESLFSPKGRGWGGNVGITNKKEQFNDCSFLLGYQDSNLE